MVAQILVGVVLGLAGAAPFAVVLTRSAARGSKGPGVKSGLACVIVSSAIILVGAALARRANPAAFVPVAVSAALALLAGVTAAALVTWHRLP